MPTNTTLEKYIAQLDDPFRIAFQNGGEIEFIILNNEAYIENHSSALYLSKSGKWGSIYCSKATDDDKELFFNILSKKDIELWRTITYIEGELYEYNKRWRTYSKQLGWHLCEDPINKKI